MKGLTLATKVRKTMSSRVHEAVKAIALCHNVTPVYESNGVTDQAEAERHYEDSCRVYQASSPDEVSIRLGVKKYKCDIACFWKKKMVKVLQSSEGDNILMHLWH